ncbi:M23 family metallopeptidase [Hyalangium rubrum]|uniref:M23 family metallopeptidase n=1 Tax=Hyalangium rubrum TaxID=3103134 RepID=A0ABU5H2M2_9BACT|nr:M23 family metallopeptidase [Hyalangium sp. s54d21]MDY7227720.1 M23 family metallopeptidase [Hyalangium sp. s54d21]
MRPLVACLLALALGACQPSPEFRRRPSPLDSRSLEASYTWRSAPRVAPDLDEAQALALAARTVLQTLPEEEQRRILESWLPFSPAPTFVAVLTPEGGVAPAPELASSRREVDLLALVRALHAKHGTRVLTLSAFFLGPEPMERARKRLRQAPERISTAALSRVLRRRERPLLRQVREAERWATLYGLGWPVDRSWRVTSRFGPRIHPILGGLSEHRGIDIATPVGTEVRAPASGVVTRVLQGPVNGHWIELDHGSGVRTHYCHLSLVEVKRGQQVQAGELVARSGDTGRVTGPHLHYQVKLPGGYVDPLGSRASVELVAAPLVLAPAPLATLPSAQ